MPSAHPTYWIIIIVVVVVVVVVVVSLASNETQYSKYIEHNFTELFLLGTGCGTITYLSDTWHVAATGVTRNEKRPPGPPYVSLLCWLRDTDNPKGRGLRDNFSWANFCCLFLVLVLVCRLEHNVKNVNHAFQ